MASVLVIAQPPMARRLSWVLEQAGHSVRVAGDAPTGMRYAEADQPHVIVINGVVPVDELDPFIQRLTQCSPQSRMLEVSTCWLVHDARASERASDPAVRR